jgi:beta-glucosidase
MRLLRPQLLWVFALSTGLFLLCVVPNKKQMHRAAEHKQDDIDSRAQTILDHMTTDQKIAQTFAGHGPQGRFLPTLEQHGLGGAKFTYLQGWADHTPEELIRTRNDLQERAMNATGGIPIFFYAEGNHGAVGGGTIFPMPVGQGCSWNTTLVRSINEAVATEAAATGIDTLFAPVVNMVADPRFGRLEENYSENPILTTKLAVEAIRGLQQHSKVAAVGKHFVAYGDASGGLNGGLSSASPRLLHDIYLRPWKAMANEGLRGLMPAHNTVLHVPCHANKWLLNDTMRNSFGFHGIVMSDCNDINVLQDFLMASNLSHAAAIALKAGVDMDLQCSKNPSDWAYNHLKEALDDNLLSEEDIDRSVKRILRHKLELGLFDDRAFADETAPSAILDNPKHRQLSLEAAEQSMVLLLNKNNTLPLSFSTVRSIALLGPAASRAGCNCSEAVSSLMGSYSFDGAHVVTLDEALVSSFPNVHVQWARGATAKGATGTGINQTEIDEAILLAKRSDVTILVLGDVEGGCGEWQDRDSLDLQGSQLALLEAVAPIAKITIVILVHGRPQTFGANNKALKHVDAMFAAWRPGEEFGTAMVNLLNGHVTPSAKLSQSWPRSVGQIGGGSVPWLQEVKGKWVSNRRGSMDEDGRRYNNYVSSSTPDPTPLFYFGRGLSYTSFRYDNMAVRTHNDVNDDVLWEIDVTISNTGNRDGVEVVQIYVRDPIGVLPYVPFWKRLVGFARCQIPAQSTETCLAIVSREDVASYDAFSSDNMRVYGGRYRVSAGGSSKDSSLVQDVLVESDPMKVSHNGEETFVTFD